MEKETDIFRGCIKCEAPPIAYCDSCRSEIEAHYLAIENTCPTCDLVGGYCGGSGHEACGAIEIKRERSREKIFIYGSNGDALDHDILIFARAIEAAVEAKHAPKFKVGDKVRSLKTGKLNTGKKLLPLRFLIEEDLYPYQVKDFELATEE
jgi:hypothetical protein